MPTAHLTAGLPPQPHQGGGARLLRRLGGAVRSVIVGGIALARTLRRPTPSLAAGARNSRDHAPCTSPARRERSPAKRAGEGAVPLLPDLLASLLARQHHRPEAASRPAFLNQTDAPFTPKACPQLSAKACAVLNTPLEDCDPKTLELLLSAFARHMSELMSPEAAITDPAASLPDLWHRLSTVLADTNADTSLPATPEAASAASADMVPDAPVASPHPPAPPSGLAWSAAKDTPRVSPLTLPGPPTVATIAAAAPKTPPDIAAPSAPAVHRSRSFQSDTQSFARRCRRHVRWCRPLSPRSLRDRRQCLPPPRRLCYAACTGPP